MNDRYKKLTPPPRQLLRLMAYLAVTLQHYEGACRSTSMPIAAQSIGALSLLRTFSM